MSKPPIAVLHEHLESHPALLAWRSFQPREEAVQRIEVLRQHGVNAVYRLVVGAAAPETVIAKRMPRAKAHPERIMYERVLPHVPVTVPLRPSSRPHCRSGRTWPDAADRSRPGRRR